MSLFRIVLPVLVAAFFWFAPYAFGHGSMAEYWSTSYLFANGPVVRLTLGASMVSAAYLIVLVSFRERIRRGVTAFERGERDLGAIAGLAGAWPLSLLPGLWLALGAYQIGDPVVATIIAVCAFPMSTLGFAVRPKGRAP